MKNLVSIDTTGLIDWYDSVVCNKTDAKAKANLEALRTIVNSRYEHYVEHFDHAKLVFIKDSKFKKNEPDLLSCYKSEGTKLSELKALIRNKQDKYAKLLCQYCGMGKPKSIDHYVPISEYPEYAVLAINLIPCCKDCNEKKKSYWKESGTRGIINFYLDNIPSRQFLFAKVCFRNNVPHLIFTIRNEGNYIDKALFDTISKHFKRLELIQLYEDESCTELDEIIRLINTYNPSNSDTKQKLLHDAKQLQLQFGTNYWRAIVRLALADSTQFINYLKTIPKPIDE
jgi:5-methylcytosine-specific restriction endonuclease McrA